MRFGLTSRIAALVAVLGVLAAPPAMAEPEYRTQSLHFLVRVGPDATITCSVVADLYTPAAASPTNRLPAVITTHGFGGSKEDQRDIAQWLASNGYVTLAYSALGFGGSGCPISMDHPDYDGKAAHQLVSFLAGQDGLAFADADHRTPVSGLDYVLLDGGADPRVGMVGGSYGGAVQFAAAAVDPRIDTIVPFVTWNNLPHSVAPNTATGPGAATTGATKQFWTTGLTYIGVNSAIEDGGFASDPTRLLPCPNFLPPICPIVARVLTDGYAPPDAEAYLRGFSVSSYIERIRIPVLLFQGQQDTLFTLNEAQATFDALRAQGTEVKMSWVSWGHSHREGAPGEMGQDAPDADRQYEAMRVRDWLAHHLKGEAVSTGPVFSYFRNWVPYTGIATPAYGVAGTADVGAPVTMHLSGDGTLTPNAAAALGASLHIATGLPAALSPPDALPDLDVPDVYAPGTALAWETTASESAVDIVGSPELKLRISTERPLDGSLHDSVVLFATLRDVAPDGTSTSINGLVAPIRMLDATAPITATLPAIVHRVQPGHRLRLTVAGSDFSYRGGLVPHLVTLDTAQGQQTLTLPIAGH